MITHIFFDMDGVLADFDGGVRDLCHLTPLPQEKSTPEQHDRLWAAVRKVPHFYGQLAPKEGAVEMFRKVYDIYGPDCEILTGIPKPRRGILTAGEDKIRWAHRYLSPEVKVNIVYREEKVGYVTGKGDILIDDYTRNIHEWEKHGGTGILFESPAQTLEQIRSYDRDRWQKHLSE